jgi:hypothetical protein
MKTGVSVIPIVLDGHYLDKPTINVRGFSGDKIKKNEMGGTCSTYGREERRIKGFGGKT